MNQGKLHVVKQDMARVNIDILGISKLKWKGMANHFSILVLRTPWTVEKAKRYDTER